MTTTMPSPVATDVRLIAIGRSESGRPFTVVSDPAFVRWQAEGAQSCGATWSDEELAEAEEQADDDDDTGLYQCLCEDDVGRLGKCPYCGGQIIPF